MARSLFEGVLRAFDANGDSVSGARLYVFLAGTTTPVTTYSDLAQTTPNAHPLVADSAGIFGDIYVGDGIYKYVMEDADGVIIRASDNVIQADFENNLVFEDRATAEGTNVNSTVQRFSVLSDFGLLEFQRDANGTALTTADGATWSPAKEASAAHFGADAYPAGSTPGDTADSSTAITNQLSWGKSANRAISLPQSYRLEAQATTPMTFGDHLSLVGGGIHTDTVIVSNTTGGLRFDGSPNRQFSVSMADMQFVPELEQSGVPFTILRNAGGLDNDSTVVLNDIYIGTSTDTDGETNDFSNGPVVTGGFRTVVHNTRLASRNSATGVKWDHVFDISDTYKPEFWGSYFNVADGAGADIGIKAHGTNEEGFLECLTTVNGADIAVSYVRDDREPEFQVLGGHKNADEKCYYIEGSKLGFIYGSLLYQGDNSTATEFIDIHLVDTEFFIIDKVQFRQAAANTRRHIVLEPIVGGVVRNVSIYLDTACLAADVGGVAPIYMNGAERVTIYVPESGASTDFASYPQRLIEFGPDQDPTEVTIRTPTGIISMSPDAAVGPSWYLERDSASPASNDILGQVVYRGRNSNDERVEYARVRGRILDATDGSEDGFVDTEIMIDGAAQPGTRVVRGAINGDAALQVAINEGGTHNLRGLRQGPQVLGGSGSRPLVYTDPAGEAAGDDGKLLVAGNEVKASGLYTASEVINNGAFIEIPLNSTIGAYMGFISWQQSGRGAMFTLSGVFSDGADTMVVLSENPASIMSVNGGVPTGTTGPNGKMNLFADGSSLYVENRIGSNRQVNVTLIGR